MPSPSRRHDDGAFDDRGDEARPYDARFLELAGPEHKATVIAPKGPRYTGKVVVLTGLQNSSATFRFARTAQREQLSTLVGETTGSKWRGINGGAFHFLRLPGTGLEAGLPPIGTSPRELQPDTGIVPEVIVPTTAAPIRRRRWRWPEPRAARCVAALGCGLVHAVAHRRA